MSWASSSTLGSMITPRFSMPCGSSSPLPRAAPRPKAPDADDRTKAGGRGPRRDRATRIDQRVAGNIWPSTYPASLRPWRNAVTVRAHCADDALKSAITAVHESLVGTFQTQRDV